MIKELVEEFNVNNMTDRLTKLDNGWDLILTTDYGDYVVLINTNQKHPKQDSWMLIAQSSFSNIEDAETEYNRLLDRYTSYTAKLITEVEGYSVEITKGTKQFRVKAISAIVDNGNTAEVYIHYSSFKEHPYLFDLLSEGFCQRYTDSWILLYKRPLFSNPIVELNNKLEEKCIFI